MILNLINEAKHTDENPCAAEVLLPINGIEIPMMTLVGVGIMFATEANDGIYENADDKETIHRKIPMCCADIVGCSYSISSWMIMDEGGRLPVGKPREIEVLWSKR